MLLAGSVSARELSQVPGVIHIQTAFDGGGNHTISQLVTLAKAEGIGVLIPTDHDLQVMEYGIPPFRNIIKKREKRDSVLELGPERYLKEISRANHLQKEVLVIPGVQSSPFYYWTGSPFKKNLVANDYRKELLLIGLQSPEDYEGLPLLHRGFSTRYVKRLIPRTIIFLVAIGLSIYLVLQKGFLRIAGGLLGVFSLLLLINHHPFQSSPYDPYHGDQGIGPFQELIDYVDERNGLSFWSHPESNYAVRGVPLGPAMLKTPHYPDDLVASTNYTGFESIYGDTITMTQPGKQWDQILNDYCTGERERPVWGISGADFRSGGSSGGVQLDTFQTIFLVYEKTTQEILNALRNGKFYAVRKGRASRLILDRFDAGDDKGGKLAISGDDLNLSGPPVVRGALSAEDGGRYQFEALLIRSGKTVKTFKGETPFTFEYIDSEKLDGKRFYRLEVKGEALGRLLSNPIFVVRG